MSEQNLAQKTTASADDVQAVQRLRDANERIVNELGKIIIGQKDVIDELMIAIFARGHCLLVGVPGLAKTLLVSTLSRTLSLSFNRIQFTPDLMPSDITGTEILADDPETGERKFKFLPGPVFANIVLADEINRTPPKTQAALLEAMQEKRVSAGGETFPLEEPFFVLATQNPLEQEGTYPLPEAQLDRFLFNIIVDYPDRGEEIAMAKRISGEFEAELEAVIGRDEIIALQKTVRRILVADHIYEYAASLVRSTRPDDPEAPEFIREWLSYGAGPRATLYLITAGKARAALRGRLHMSIEDVQALAPAILRHRIIPNFAARSEEMTSDLVIKKLLETIPADENLYDGKAS
ncbi:MAG: MoxR-like ATPase [Verrucomicrobiales bacterium]|jgi:MoxR-like ATPase